MTRIHSLEAEESCFTQLKSGPCPEAVGFLNYEKDSWTQQWFMTMDGEIKNKHEPEKCLEHAGNGLHLIDCHQGSNLKWEVTAQCQIKQLGANLCVWTPRNGGRTEMQDCDHSSAAQKFIIADDLGQTPWCRESVVSHCTSCSNASLNSPELLN